MNNTAVNTYVIALGSNVADGRRFINKAISLLRRRLVGLSVSSVYSTPSVSCGDNSIYFNAVAMGRSHLSTRTLNSMVKRWELLLGRDRSAKHTVTIDIDIVLCNDRILRPRDFRRRYFVIGYNQLQRNNANAILFGGGR